MTQATAIAPNTDTRATGTAQLVRSGLYVGLDVGDRKTHACVLDKDGAVIDRFAFTTESGELASAFALYRECRVALEVGSQSPWMSASLRQLGHDVIVADARRVAAFIRGGRKTDRRDAETIAKLLRGMPEMLGNVYHRGEDAQADLAVVRARDAIVRGRTRLITHVRGTLKAQGVRVRNASADTFHRVAQEHIPVPFRQALNPLLALIDLPRRDRTPQIAPEARGCPRWRDDNDGASRRSRRRMPWPRTANAGT